MLMVVPAHKDGGDRPRSLPREMSFVGKLGISCSWQNVGLWRQWRWDQRADR